MKSLILIALLFGAAQAVPRRDSLASLTIVKGPPKPNVWIGDRIAGGQLASRGQFPFMGRLWHNLGTGYWALCGGSLLNEEWFLTAGHCVDGGLQEFIIYFGALNPDDGGDPERVDAHSSQGIVHPDFDGDYLYNDIALVKLESPVQFSDVIQPITLPTHSQAGDDFAGRDVTAVGWGVDGDDDSSNDPLLKWVNLVVATHDQCYSDWSFIIDAQLCTLPGGGKSPCSGDSGSPLVLTDGLVQIAITSFGSGGCPVTTTNGFTRTAPYLDWITETTGIQIP